MVIIRSATQNIFRGPGALGAPPGEPHGGSSGEPYGDSPGEPYEGPIGESCGDSPAAEGLSPAANRHRAGAPGCAAGLFWKSARQVAASAARPLPVVQVPLRLAYGPPGELIVVCGGSSRGPADHLRKVLEELGAEVLVDGVAVRPGHPQLLAELPDGRLVVGLPGNPYAALVAALAVVPPGWRGEPVELVVLPTERG